MRTLKTGIKNLAAAVINLAIEDTAKIVKTKAQEINKSKARQFFETKNKNFDLCCEIAGFDRDCVYNYYKDIQ